MEPYFIKYWRYFVVGMVMGVIGLVIYIISEVF